MSKSIEEMMAAKSALIKEIERLVREFESDCAGAYVESIDVKRVFERRLSDTGYGSIFTGVEMYTPLK